MEQSGGTDLYRFMAASTDNFKQAKSLIQRGQIAGSGRVVAYPEVTPS